MGTVHRTSRRCPGSFRRNGILVSSRPATARAISAVQIGSPDHSSGRSGWSAVTRIAVLSRKVRRRQLVADLSQKPVCEHEIVEVVAILALRVRLCAPVVDARRVRDRNTHQQQSEFGPAYQLQGGASGLSKAPLVFAPHQPPVVPFILGEGTVIEPFAPGCEKERPAYLYAQGSPEADGFGILPPGKRVRGARRRHLLPAHVTVFPRTRQ